MVSGRRAFRDGRQDAIVTDIEEHLARLNREALGEAGQEYIRAAIRVEETLRSYVELLNTQIRQGKAVSFWQDTEADIRSNAELIDSLMQEFCSEEIRVADSFRAIMRRNTTLLAGAGFLAVCAAALWIIIRHADINAEISRAIGKMDAFAGKVAGGDLTVRTSGEFLEEFVPLASSLNEMARQIQTLMERSVEEQKAIRKYEMIALQAQITPHFLYNTFDSIVSLAEADRMNDVVEITMAFSRFFRISLSRGQDWITVEQEEQHIRSYLTIQKYRYGDKLSYEIDIDPAIRRQTLLKLILQPLAENSIYHGIRSPGGAVHLEIRGRQTGPEEMCFMVSDNGEGMTAEELAQLRDSISGDRPGSTGYGLYNVCSRLRLYYGTDCLAIESTEGMGTDVMITLPFKGGEGLV